MEHPNAHAGTPTRELTSPPRRRSTVVVTGCVVAALAMTPLLGDARAPAGGLPPLDPLAKQATPLGSDVVAFSVPTKHGHGGAKKHKSGKSHRSHDSDKKSDSSSGTSPSGESSSEDSSSRDSTSSSDSGSASVSNTVNGREADGAQTYNNHTVSPNSSGDAAITNSPVQLNDNTSSGAPTLNSRESGSGGDGGGSASTNSSDAVSSAVMLVRVSCPTSVAAGTVCLQVTSPGGGAASLPATTPASNLPTSSGLSNLTPDSPSASVGQAGAGGRVDVSALESQSGEKIELTGYSFQDNQGGNNAKISCPQIHQQAGGTGTFTDPITVASGGKSGGSSADGIKCGDRFYIPAVQRYVIVEDTGNTPSKSMPHLDMYVADDPNKSCMNKISGTVTAIPHPPSGLPVLAGPIGDHGSCRLPGGEQ